MTKIKIYNRNKSPHSNCSFDKYSDNTSATPAQPSKRPTGLFEYCMEYNNEQSDSIINLYFLNIITITNKVIHLANLKIEFRIDYRSTITLKHLNRFLNVLL